MSDYDHEKSSRCFKCYQEGWDNAVAVKDREIDQLHADNERLRGLVANAAAILKEESDGTSSNRTVVRDS